jgi:DNA-3-methyladenine glycosylase
MFGDEQMTKVLSRSFYERDTSEVARALLGKSLVRRGHEGLTSGKIVETEAYYGKGDPASRASRGKTKMNEIMWGPASRAFVYMVHAQWLFNVTTEREGVPGAVLIRALEPLDGVELMQKRRGMEFERDLTSGPGKLTKAMAITKAHHGLDLTNPNGELMIIEGKPQNLSIVSSHRIGVSADLERKLRFYIEGNPFVSR